ncbi:aldehyde-activating protein [Agarivorans sp. Toyoura001]|uniref:GFA family protein n=1 Tax=Agarivorans sp. Toyoura001 TaxID=2283141 RepID=UPI0010D520F7|nr:GFA family protein [Agarivorans sp. Toyoura001]GDY25814.1 aldehyde-activating protein [Agarivorans sp. Toyoura001]
MQEADIEGSCLCGEVHYQINGNLGIFQYCHCSRCRKFTGSAHAANLFVLPSQFRWLAGEDKVQQYQPEHTKYFATAFCRTCGSSLPWLAKTGKTMVIPAGTLDQHPNIEPIQNIFCADKAPWFVDNQQLPQFAALPPRKPKA